MSDDITANDIAQLENLIQEVNDGLLSGKKQFIFMLNEFTEMLPKIYGEAQWNVEIRPLSVGAIFVFTSTMKPWTERLILNDTPHRPT